jgi:hypothetical protein
MGERGTSNTRAAGLSTAPFCYLLASNSMTAKFSIAPFFTATRVNEVYEAAPDWDQRRKEAWPFLEPDEAVRRR